MSEQDPRATSTDKHPLEHGLEAAAVVPPVGQRDSDRVLQPDTRPNRSIRRRLLDSTLGKVAVWGGAALVTVSAVVGLKFANDVSNAVENPQEPGVSGPQSPGTDTEEVPSNPEVKAPTDRVPTVLTDEERQLFESYGDNYTELTIPTLENIRSIVLELYQKDGDPSDVDFSSITDDRRVKAELRLIAEHLLTNTSDLTDIKMCLPAGDYQTTAGTENCDSFTSELSLPGLDSMVTIRNYTQSDPNSELTENTNQFFMGSHLVVDDDNKLKLIKTDEE